MHYAQEIIKRLERRLKNRGSSYQSRGVCLWELEVLWLAYEQAQTPKESRLFGLHNVDTLTEIKPLWSQRHD